MPSARSLTLHSESQVDRGAALLADVVIHGAAPGATVEVTLRQTVGVRPFFEALLRAVADDNGEATAFFDGIHLRGPTRAVLVASATDGEGRGYGIAASHVQVT